MDSGNFIYGDQTPWTDTDPGVRRQILAWDESLMMVRVSFRSGAQGSPHTHPHTQATYVESGLFEFTNDGQTATVGPGDSVYIRPGVLHGCRCLSQGSLIDVFSPMRGDFLG